MAYLHRLTLGVITGNGPVNAQITKTLAGEDSRALVLPANSRTEVDLDFDLTRLEDFVLLTDQEIVVKTNDATSPDDQFTVTAGGVLLWYDGAAWDNPFTENVNRLFLEVGPTGATVNIVVGVNAATSVTTTTTTSTTTTTT